MPTRIEIEARPTFRDYRGRFARAEEALLKARLDGVEALGREHVRLLREEAPKGKTGKFAAGIGMQTYQASDAIGYRIGLPSPLSRFIIDGTKPHIIRPKKAKALVFFWQKIGRTVVVPAAGGFTTHVRDDVLWIGRGYVKHPGTKPNPFHTRAWERLRPIYDQAIRRISTRVRTVLDSGT